MWMKKRALVHRPVVRHLGSVQKLRCLGRVEGGTPKSHHLQRLHFSKLLQWVENHLFWDNVVNGWPSMNMHQYRFSYLTCSNYNEVKCFRKMPSISHTLDLLAPNPFMIMPSKDVFLLKLWNERKGMYKLLQRHSHSLSADLIDFHITFNLILWL